MTITSVQIQLASRPGAEGPSLSNFRRAEVALTAPEPGQVLLETLWLSLDPYMRARMYESGNYAASTPPGAVMPGQTVARVIQSRAPALAEGSLVLSAHGWQSHHVTTPDALSVVDPTLAPPSTALGVLGMPGLTGYGGLLRHGAPQAGETVVVSAASGAVGSVVGQVARLQGCRVVGVAGGPRKCDWLTKELGFDAAVDHRAEDMAQALAAACPQGVDVYFDNTGGAILRAVLPLLNTGARVPVCGTISIDRNRPGASAQGPTLDEVQALILVKQLTLRGFLFDSLLDLRPQFEQDMAGWIRSGALRYRESIVDGLDAAPQAFLGLFRGENFGKLLVRVA